VRGEAVDPAEIYFRTTPRFTSSHPDYAALSSRLFVGIGEREPSRVILSVFVVR
jgi:hypothetical protein